MAPPKGPRRTKNSTRSKFTTRSIFSTAGWFTIAARLVRTPLSWELQTSFLSKKGPRLLRHLFKRDWKFQSRLNLFNLWALRAISLISAEAPSFFSFVFFFPWCFLFPWFNNVQTRCIVKGEAQKSPLFWRFSGVFLVFSGSPVL